MIPKFLILAATVNFLFSGSTAAVICYYESWSQWSYAPGDIDTDICTHINYAFLGINEDGTLRLDDDDDILYRLSDLKSRNPSLKLLFSVGGWDEGSTKFSHVAADKGKKATMANDILRYINKYNFDGVDIDWEFPTQNGGIDDDKEHFIDMLWIIRDLFNDNGGYLITVAVSSDPDNGHTYNVQAMSKVVDFINVMTYDFHGAYNGGKTAENSPLYGSSTDSQWESEHSNCDVSIHNWINAGADPGKINIGLAFYGHTFKLANPDQHGIGAPVSGVGLSDGYMGYSEICKLQDEWTEEWDSETQNPYKYSGNQWIGYDNPRSIGLKVQYAKNHGLAGVMMWAVDNDDKNGDCGERQPLLQAIKNNL